MSVEEVFLKKKNKLAEIGISLLEDPEANIKSLKDLLQFCHDKDHKVVKLGLLSLLAVFKDIIPGYFFDFVLDFIFLRFLLCARTFYSLT